MGGNPAAGAVVCAAPELGDLGAATRVTDMRPLEMRD
jgi:hypothetical protein